MQDNTATAAGTPGGAPDSAPDGDQIATQWLGQGLEMLVERCPGIDSTAPAPGFDVDLVIVGSGYGAAVAARQLAGCRPLAEPGQPDAPPLSIAILERGHEYLAGAFPERLADLAGHVRFSTTGGTAAQGRRSGLFDLRLGGDAMALVANGVGGGSLINAGVMLQPRPAVFQQPNWPAALRTPGALDRHFDEVQRWLGAGTAAAPNTIDLAAGGRPAKTTAMHRLGPARVVPITVALKADTRTEAGVALDACIGCGDCATGCNHNAKHSLDVGLLAQACLTPGVALYTGATVLWVQPLADVDTGGQGTGWAVVVQHTDDKLRARQPRPFHLRARWVVLAAGTLGSTEILLRSRQHGLALSPRLGERFSTNGDLITALHDTTLVVNAVADEDQHPGARAVGPTITAMVDRRDECIPFVLQDLAVPGPLRQAFQEVFTTAATLHSLGRRDKQAHHAGDADPCAVDAAAIKRTLPLAMIGHDSADGRLALLSAAAQPPATGGVDAPADLPADEGDGALQIVWSALRRDPRWVDQHRQLRTMAAGTTGGQVLPNPLWQLLPEPMQTQLDVPQGPLLTVHPLGGCAMGGDATQGVVDACGRVFNGHPSALQSGGWHAGLVVLDGAIVPGSLGINPALTIAALAHRAAEQLRRDWQLGAPQPAVAQPRRRPVLRPPLPAGQPMPTRRPTRVELVERMAGPVTLAGGRQAWMVLTLYSQPTALRDLLQPAPDRRIVLDAARSSLHIWRNPPARNGDQPSGETPLLQADVAGHLAIFQHAPTGAIWRSLRAGWHWLVNRGLRDGLQRLADGPPTPEAAMGRFDMLGEAWRLASHAGAVRVLDYHFTLHRAKHELAPGFADGMAMAGSKRLHYGRATSPLRQLMQMQLLQCPPLDLRTPPVLSLDLRFLGQQGVPLMRLVDQQDQPTALADTAAFLAYVTRILVKGNLWSFRKPDAAPQRTPQRLPGEVPGAPSPQIHLVQVCTYQPATQAPTQAPTQPVHIRLANYRPAVVDDSLPPVLLIHGYSASGTTFAHPTLNPGLMRHLTSAHRRDVWVLDLRSSCGMPTAAHPWAFEDMGCEDIPLAVHQVCQATGQQQVDIVAHCMGAAMLCMGLLGKQHGPMKKADGSDEDLLVRRLGRHEELRHALWDRDLHYWQRDTEESENAGSAWAPRSRIRRLVLSQVGPALLLTPGNVARAYLMRYVKQFIQGVPYAFSPPGPTGLADQLLDRLLAAMPYPEGDFGQENPWWPPGRRLPWVGTRHRIDALFGRVFNLPHMADDTLAQLDDFFGPFNVDTVSQVIHFARHGLLTDRSGFNRFVDVARLPERLTFPILSLHAQANGLADVGTGDALQTLLRNNLGPGGSHTCCTLADPTLGHQDSLIGKLESTAPVLQAISDFLQQHGPAAAEDKPHA